MKAIHKGLSIGPQPHIDDLEVLYAQGFRAIIATRPDGEDAGQVPFGRMKAAAKALGMEARHIPVQPGMIHDTDAAAFGKAMHDLPGPVAAYCRSGMRASSLWSKAAAMDPTLNEKFGIEARPARSGFFSGLSWLRRAS